MNVNATTTKSKKGFASMSPEKRKEIASKGGKSAHTNGTAFKFNSETGRLAGKIGGRAVSEDKEHMAEIGRKGGIRSTLARGQKPLGPSPQN